MILGVDFSHWQGKPDAQKLADNNVKFAIVKAGEVVKGNLYYDDKHDRNIRELKRVGIICGDYYYFHPKAGASKQARHYADIWYKNVPDLPPVIDIEDTDGYNPQDVQKQLFAFINELRARIDRSPIIYSRNGFIVNQIGDPNWPDGILFWIARYYKEIGALSPRIKNKTVIWQFTDRIKLPGLPTMDGNYWLKDEADLNKLAGKKMDNGSLQGLEDIYYKMGIRSRWLERHLKGA